MVCPHFCTIFAPFYTIFAPDDNAYAEALFRTAKYWPEFPAQRFDTLHDARHWAHGFTQWYNHEHRHSGTRYVTPSILN